MSHSKELSTMSKNHLFNFVIFSHVYYYLNIGLEKQEPGEFVPEICYNIRTKCKNYTLINRLDDNELSVLRAAEGKSTIKEDMGIEFAFIIFALHLMKLYSGIEKSIRFNLNISDKKLILGAAPYIMPMLRLRAADPEIHKEKRAIIDHSKEVAEKLFNFAKSHILGEEDGKL